MMIAGTSTAIKYRYSIIVLRIEKTFFNYFFGQICTFLVKRMIIQHLNLSFLSQKWSQHLILNVPLLATEFP